MTAPIVNTAMAEAWNGAEGEDWARDWQRYDQGVAAYHRRLLEACAPAAGERALDVGCGNGQVGRELAARGMRVTGVDLSGQMVARGTELAAGNPDVELVVADAQVHPFPDEEFDLVVSRFGAMFFADRQAAFGNLARATRPGGRIALVAWQGIAGNEWLQEIRGALALGRELPTPPVGVPGPFGLGDAPAACEVLRRAGYGDAQAEALAEPFWAGVDADDAYAFVSRTGVVRGLLEGLPQEHVERGLAQLRASLEAHQGEDGVVYGSSAWLFTGTRDTGGSRS
jgi:SAM-dependent methyltransferase